MATGTIVHLRLDSRITNDDNNHNDILRMYPQFNAVKLIAENNPEIAEIPFQAIIKLSRKVAKTAAQKYENKNIFNAEYGRICADNALFLLEQGNFDKSGRTEKYQSLVATAREIFQPLDPKLTAAWREYARMEIAIFKDSVQKAIPYDKDINQIKENAIIANNQATASYWTPKQLLPFTL